MPDHSRHIRHLEHQAHHRAAQAPMGNLTGSRLDPNTQYQRDWFTYVFNIGSIIANAQGQTIINIQADSDFELMQINAQGNKNGASEPWPNNILLPFTIFITDTGTGRNLMQAPIPVNMLSGRGELPFILPQDRIFEAKSTIQLQWQGYGAGTYDNIYVGFIGAKLFKYG